jgi:hypothetical protein
MRVDTYAKIILTIIALSMILIAATPLLRPHGVMAQGPTQGLQMAVTSDGAFVFFDARTGDVWVHKSTSEPFHYRLAVPGKPLTEFEWPSGK